MIGRLLSPVPFVALLLFVPLAAAQSAEAIFHEAYFLEQERGDAERALALYEKLANDPQADAAVKQEAVRRARGLAEELGGRDLARLMPTGAILYVELDRPGAKLALLLEQLGLLGSFRDSARSGSLAVSPELVQSLLGIRGAALAITGPPAGAGPPPGVLVFHPGAVGALRGLIETAVPAQGRAEDAIEGHPTWSLQGEVLVTLTERLVVVSQQRQEIAGVLRRLKGEDSDSLAADARMGAYLAGREDALFFACIDARPVRPLLGQLLAQQGGERGQAVLREVLDVESLVACVARAGVGADGLALEASLHLEEDHRNLVFNLLRPAGLDAGVLDLVPAGAAAFLAVGLNPRGSALAPLAENADGAPVVTAADLGRELSANLAALALFVLPGEGPFPQAGLVLSSNDPARSRAVLSLLLGLASLASTGRSLEPEEGVVGGAESLVFRLPPGIPLQLVESGENLLLSASPEVLEQALAARAQQRSVRGDSAFQRELERVGPGTSLVLLTHLGRALAVARNYLPPAQRQALEPIAPCLEQTVVALRADHGASSLGLALALHGIPRIDGLVGQLLARQKAGGSLGMHGHAPAAPLVDAGTVREQFDRLALEQGDGAAARALVLAALPALAADPRGLNNLAWALLTEEPYHQRFDDLALVVAQGANEASGFSVWQYLDTLALAKFRSGAVAEAIRIQEAALARTDDPGAREELSAALERFRSAQGEAVAVDPLPR